jgi:hypothetical protein
VGEELEIGLAESGEDKVDLRVETVGSELGAPAAMSSAETNGTRMTEQDWMGRVGLGR